MKLQFSTYFKFRILIFCISLVVSFASIAQIPGRTQFTINDGLPSNTVYDIIQDAQGYLYFATDFGISKFDGTNFINYTVEDGLPDNEILCFFKDSKQRIWVFGFNGKIGFIYKNKIHNSENTEFLKQFNSTFYIYDFIEDAKGNIWFLNSNKETMRLNAKNQLLKKTVKPFNDKSTFYLVEDYSKNIYLINKIVKNIPHEIYLFNLSNETNSEWTGIDLANLSMFNVENIKNKRSALISDFDAVSQKIHQKIITQEPINEGNLLYRTYFYDSTYWVTSLNKGAYIFKFDKLLNNPIYLLPQYQTTRAFQDREKNIWIGTISNGIILFPDFNTSSITFDNLIENDIYTVNILGNHIFLGTGFGSLLVLDKNTLKHTKTIQLNKNLISDRAKKSVVIGKEFHFLSNKNYTVIDDNLNVKKINPKKYFVDVKKQVSYKDISIKNNITYIANAAGLFSIDFNQQKSEVIYNIRTTATYKGEKDTLWMGTSNGLLLMTKDTVQKYPLNNNFNTTTITEIVPYNKGILISSTSRGLGFLKNNKFYILDKNNGLLSNSIKSIFIAPNNELWIATNFGLNRVKTNQNFKPISIESYTISEGLNTNDVRNCFVTNDFAYVATSKGLNIIDLKSKKNIFVPPTVHIKEIILNNKHISLDDYQKFSSNNNNIQFNYSGISFKSIGYISFKYRLEGLENDWILTKNNSVRYAALPFGKYTFQLKSITKNGIESDDMYLYHFEINRPFYHTWLFRIFGVVFLFGSLYSWYFFRINQLKKEKEIEEKISNLRFKALNAQMNPHFINNLLTMIIDLIAKGEKQKALKNLFTFSNLVNMVLQSTKTNLISLQQELNFLQYFIDLNSLKYQNELVLNITLNDLNEEDLEAIKIPPMILQPIVENCIRHGLESEHPIPTINLDLAIQNDEFLICTITDNGKGITATESQSKFGGISLHNIDERLMLMNDKKSSDCFVTMSNLSDEMPNLTGTKIELRIPLIYL